MSAVAPHLLKHLSASSSASISIPAFAGWWNWLKVNVTPKPSSCCQFSPRPLSYHPATPETELHQFPWIFPLLNILNLHYFPKVFPGYFEDFKLRQLPEYIKDFKDTPVTFFYFLNILNIWKLRYIPQIFPISWHRCYCHSHLKISQELNFSLIGRSWTWHYPSSKLGIRDGGGLKQISPAMSRIIKWHNNSMKSPMLDKVSYHAQQHPQICSVSGYSEGKNEM